MSFWTRLFGGAKLPETGSTKPTAEIEHSGFTIRAEPYRAEGGQFQTAGTIVKVVDGETREHRFVRADRFAGIEDATQFALSKGRQIVDEQGERLFRAPARPAGPPL